ncbi:MAG TPA: NADH-quinone oxidoreductase subunit NuoE [Halanaerobiales bacterium]|nr:NADH-quinone oxidoreductase subunit NuoE [Halanaerobiales bacterium]
MSCRCDQKNMDKYLAPLNEILKEYTKEEKYLIPILQDAQDEYGYLPEAVLKEIACNLDLSLSQVFGVVTFYSQFHLEPRGENIIRVCTGTACHVRGGAEVLDQLKEELNIGSGETTDDLTFTLETVACIGACGLAPVIMVNDDTYGRMKPGKVSEVLANYQE